MRLPDRQSSSEHRAGKRTTKLHADATAGQEPHPQLAESHTSRSSALNTLHCCNVRQQVANQRGRQLHPRAIWRCACRHGVPSWIACLASACTLLAHLNFWWPESARPCTFHLIEHAKTRSNRVSMACYKASWSQDIQSARHKHTHCSLARVIIFDMVIEQRSRVAALLGTPGISISARGACGSRNVSKVHRAFRSGVLSGIGGAALAWLCTLESELHA